MSTTKALLTSIVLSTMLVSTVNLSTYTRQSNEPEPPGRSGRIGLVSQSKI